MEFIDTMRAEGHAVEPICAVLRERGCQVAARTYRVWKQAGRPVAARTLRDAEFAGAIRDVCCIASVREPSPQHRLGVICEGISTLQLVTSRRDLVGVVAKLTE